MALYSRPRNANTQPVVPDAETFLGDELIAIPTTAGGTALASVPTGARHAVIENIDGTNKIIVRLSGNPDATHGHVVKAGTVFDLKADPSKVKILADTASVNVFVSYFGEQG